MPVGDYAAKDLKLKRVAGIADDFAFGHENVAGFLRVFEDSGGKVVQKLWPPLNAPDYGDLYLAAQAEPRRRLYRTCRLERLQVHQAAARIRQQVADPRRLHAGRRIAAAADGRRRARRHHRQLVFGAARQSDQQALRRRDPEGLQGRSRRLCGGDLSLRRGAGRGRCKAGERQCRGQGQLHEGAERREPEGVAARPDALRRIRQRGRQQLHPQGRAQGRQAGQRGGEDLSRSSASSGPTSRRNS